MANKFWAVTLLLVPLALGGCGVYPGSSPYGYNGGYGGGGYGGYGYGQSYPGYGQAYGCYPGYAGAYPQPVQPYYEPGGVVVVPPASTTTDPVTQTPTTNHYAGSGVVNSDNPRRRHRHNHFNSPISQSQPGSDLPTSRLNRQPQNPQQSPWRRQTLGSNSGAAPNLSRPGMTASRNYGPRQRQLGQQQLGQRQFAPRQFSQRPVQGTGTRSRGVAPQAMGGRQMSR